VGMFVAIMVSIVMQQNGRRELWDGTVWPNQPLLLIQREHFERDRVSTFICRDDLNHFLCSYN